MSNQDWASKAYQEIIETGNDWADKRSAFNLMDKNRHSVLAKIKLSFVDIKSDAAKETAARASNEYQQFLNELAITESDYLHAEVKHFASKTLASLRQTQESLKKAEITAQNNMA